MQGETSEMAKSTWPGKMRRRVKSFALFAVLTLVFYLLMRRMKSDFSGTQRYVRVKIKPKV